MEYLLDESGRQQLMDLLLDGPASLFVESAQALLYGLGAGSDVQGVLGDFPWYARHVRGTPRKYDGICAEKVDEHYFLFALRLELILNALPSEVAGSRKTSLVSSAGSKLPA